MGGITPYICVADSRAAIAFYERAFGAHVSDDPIVMDDGRVGHCEVEIDGNPVMMSDPFDTAGVAPPDPGRGNAVTLHVEVDDCDAWTERAVAAGAVLDRGPEDSGPGRVAVLHDPFGHRWFLTTPTPDEG